MSREIALTCISINCSHTERLRRPSRNHSVFVNSAAIENVFLEIGISARTACGIFE
jgi:hypothetical protein